MKTFLKTLWKRKNEERQSAIVGAGHTLAQARGRQAEALAEAHLAAHGLRPLARNARCRGGEVDLICLDGDTVVFVEVRLRNDKRFGSAADSIGVRKQRRIVLAARHWLHGEGRRHAARPCRFDAVLFDNADITDTAGIVWLRAAFDVA